MQLRQPVFHNTSREGNEVGTVRLVYQFWPFYSILPYYAVFLTPLTFAKSVLDGMCDSFVLANLFETFFAPINISALCSKCNQKTHVGLCVKYWLLTRCITCRLQILVEYTNIIFNHFYFASRFMTFRSKILIFGVVPKDRHGKANRRIRSFRYVDDKGRKN
jgi:hypothetical protein